MPSADVVCCLKVLTYLSKGVNIVTPDQVAPTGAAQYGSTLFSEKKHPNIQQTTKTDDKSRRTLLLLSPHGFNIKQTN